MTIHSHRAWFNTDPDDRELYALVYITSRETPDGTYVKKGYTAVNKMVAKSFGRWSRYPKGKPRVPKDVKNMTRKTGSKKDRSDGRRTKKKGKGKGKGKGGKGSYKRTPSPTP